MRPCSRESQSRTDMTYICRTKCFYGGRLYEVGDAAEFSAVTPPEHFIPLAGETATETPAEKPVEKHGAEPEPVKPKRGRMAKAKEKDRG